MLLRLLLAALGGLGLWLAFPSFDLWFLAPVGMALIVLALTGVGLWRGAFIGLVAGWACFIPLVSWSGIFVGTLPWMALATLCAAYVAAFGAVAAYLQGRHQHTAVRPFAVALAWMVAEFARATTPFGGFPWGRLGFSQADSPALAVVAWVGVPGLGLLVTFCGGLLALALHSIFVGSVAHESGADYERPGLGRRLGTTVLATALAVGVFIAPAALPRPTDGDPVQVVAIQGNVPEMSLEFNAQRRAVLDNHVNTTLEAAQRVSDGDIPAPDLVVWPENSSDIDPLRNGDAATIINEAVDTIGAPLLVGAVLAPPDEPLANASLLYLPGQGPVQSYVKRSPVPFAEYMPYRDFFRRFSDKVDLLTRDFGAGDAPGVLDVPLDGPAAQEPAGSTLRLGVAICFEVVIDDVMADTVREGADLIAVPTNNATFGFTDESEQQLAASRVKAVELGRSIVHISTVGVSAFVAPDGSVSEGTDLFTQDILSGSMTRRTQVTPAVVVGPWLQPAGSALLALLVLGAAMARRRSPVTEQA